MKNLLIALALLAPFIFGSIAFAYNVETEPQNVNKANKTAESIADALKTQDIDLTVPGQVLHIYKAMRTAGTSNTQLDGTSEAAATKTEDFKDELPLTQKDITMSSLPENSMVETINADEIDDSFNSMFEASNTEEAAANTVSSPAVESTNTLEETSTDYESDALESANDVINEPDNTGESAVDAEDRTADVIEPQPTQEDNQFDAGDFTKNELDLLARLVRAEAQTEPFEGKIAVACVVLNRVKSSQFPDTIIEVIYQPRQFQPVSNNQINKPADTESIKAVQAALTDHQHIAEESLFFYNPDIATSRWLDSRETTVVIGQHVFKK